jgi:hypothetical protein
MIAGPPQLRARIDSRFAGREEGHDPKAVTFGPDDSLQAYFSKGILRIEGLLTIEEGPGRTLEKKVNIEIGKELIQEAVEGAMMLSPGDFTINGLAWHKDELKLVVKILRLIQDVDRNAIIRAANAIETLAGLDEEE